jgi:hypothetical protein
MKNEERLNPSESPLLSGRDVLPVSVGQAQDTVPMAALKAVASNRSSKGAVVLDDRPLADADMVDEPVAVQDKKQPLPLETLPLPALRLRYITLKGSDLRKQVRTHTVDRDSLKEPVELAPNRSPWQRIKAIDIWLIATFMLACIAGGLSLWYSFSLHQTMLYGDANAHLLIARRVFDNLTPGLAQLGAIWLPLPHLLMLPFVWNDFLWRTGLAGSIVSLLSYLVASVYIFLSARRLTKSNVASFIGSLVFILNPNILYLQTTPLSELVFIATLAATCYYFLVWAQTDSTRYLILAAAATFLTSLCRYDGWFVFVVILVCIVLIGLVRRHRLRHIEANLFIFGSMGSLGMVLWFVWNGLIFGDPLYFQHSQFSSEAQQRSLLNSHILYTYHNLYQAIRFYLIDCIDTVGPLLFGIATLALLVFLVQRRLKPETFAALVFASPILFYMIALYTGQAALYLPTAVPGYAPYTLYNARYGEVVVMPAAVFLACLLSFFSHSQQLSSLRGLLAQSLGRATGRYVFPLLFLVMVVGQSVWIANDGIIMLQDGQHGLACTPTSNIVVYLAQHYNGGKILEDLYTAKIDTLEPTVGINFKNMIYEGSGDLWTKALRYPQSVVDWIIVNPANPQDAIAKEIDLKSPAFTSQFSLVLQQQNGLALYLRSSLVFRLPTHNVPRSVYTDHQLCPVPDRAQLPIPIVRKVTYS